MTALDAGLLSPVRAGTRAEAAVDDRAWLQGMLTAEAALARAQARLGALPANAARTITEAAVADEFDVRELALAARESANPVVPLVAALTRRVGRLEPAAAEYVHRGSTSQDVFDTGAMLVSAQVVRLLRVDLHRCAEALASLARRHRDTPMPGRTLALHAVPVTFGLKAAGWRRALLEADERLGRVLDELPVSLGGAAGTLAGYVEFAAGDGAEDASGGYAARLTEAFAEETGLAVPPLPWHARRTPLADLGSVLGLTAGALGKFAVDVQVLARTEVGEVSEPSVAGRGSSSAMPHKRNPVLATLVRSAALQVPVLATGLTQSLLSEDERSGGGWHAEWQLLREALRLTGGAAETAVELAEGLRVHESRMRENLALTGSRIVSERVAAALAPHLGKQEARRALAEASADAEATGRPLAEVLAERPAIKAELGLEKLAELTDPLGYAGAAGELVDRELGR
ncbi:3-carboxy-cis,cis-muconate cycloisomerase [Streptomyces sulphureus]|uniref:3-carboxy-cis,cis-muconate cycloisomerase n=1 Tax=Streptomyces sulphureus TaxID=47758 RepID=UPI0003620D2E|nr:3-carboxy-cis,cis-muconate cycloisomerase [Streptomyces sulphureus]